MSAGTLDTYEMRTPDAEEWRGVPFRHARDMPGGVSPRPTTAASTTEAPSLPRRRAIPPRAVVAASDRARQLGLTVMPGARRTSGRRALGSGPPNVSRSPSAGPVRA